jgi:Protein of unknown function (DUF1207)
MTSCNQIRVRRVVGGAMMLLIGSISPSAAGDTLTSGEPASVDCRFAFNSTRPAEDRISRPIAAFPDNDVFRPPLADLKQPRFFATYQALRVRNPAPEQNLGSSVQVGSVGFGENFGLLGRRNGCDGWQVGILAGVFAQFNLDTSSEDLINADYVIGIPWSWRRGLVSTRARLYHQSSHLGDEFLLGNPGISPMEFSFEEMEVLVSLDTRSGWARVYAGGGYLVHTKPKLDPLKVQWGLELRGPTHHTSVYGGFLPDLRIVPILGADFKTFQDLNWALNTNLVAGLELYRGSGSRRFRVLVNYYYGYNPYGQFFRQKVETVGIGGYLEF